MNITLQCKRAIIEANYSRKISVEIEGLDKNELMENLKITDFLDFFDISNILDEIGQEKCEEYFDLMPKTE